MSDQPRPRRGTVFTPVIPRVSQAADPEAAKAMQVVMRMFEQDAFSQWLGVEVVEVSVGRCVLTMTMREEMANGFGTAHGGIVFAFSDTALAFCTNADGKVSVALDCSISYPTAVKPGDVLTAVGVMESTTRKVGFASVTVTNQRDETVGHFRGTVYRTEKSHR